MANFDIKIKVIFENDEYLVIDKPAGLLVQPTTHQRENTLVEWLVNKYPEIVNIGQQDRPGIVHRLDKDVSGLMVIAKTQGSYQNLVGQFKNSRVKKEYSAIVYGLPSLQKGTINLPVGRTKKGKLIAIKYRKGVKLEKSAVTEYEVVKSFNNFSLLKIKPLTGRTHQIRIHLRETGCPIVGDQEHGIKNKELKIKNGPTRIFLHASYLGFYDLSGQWQECKSELPKEMSEFI